VIPNQLRPVVVSPSPPGHHFRLKDEKSAADVEENTEDGYLNALEVGMLQTVSLSRIAVSAHAVGSALSQSA
jgi:hypothetical protein